MGDTIRLEDRVAGRTLRQTDTRAESGGKIVPYKRTHVPTVVETVRVLRMMNDKSLLDNFNQRRDD